MASDVLPDPDTPTTATVRHSGTSTSMSRRLLCRAPRTPMTVGRVPGTEISPAAIPGNLSHRSAAAEPGQRDGDYELVPGSPRLAGKPKPPNAPGVRKAGISRIF